VAYNHYCLSKTWNLRHFLINTAADYCVTIGILFNHAVNSAHNIASNEWMIRRGELGTTWKEPFWLKVRCYRSICWRKRENQDNFRQILPSLHAFRCAI